MGRITKVDHVNKRINFSNGGQIILKGKESKELADKITRRLAEYEDIGSVEELKQLKAERDKAVEDLKVMANGLLESDNYEACCFACAYNEECAGCDSNEYFKWRGLEGTHE